IFFFGFSFLDFLFWIFFFGFSFLDFLFWNYSLYYLPIFRFLNSEIFPFTLINATIWENIEGAYNMYDVIIAGGGSMGIAAAYFRAKQGARVLVLDQF